MLTWQYVAGFFDGEGHVGLSHSSRLRSSHIEVSMYQSAERGQALFNEMKEWFYAQGIACKIYKRRPRGNCKEMYNLDFTGRDNYTKFLQNVFPYLHIKKIEVQDTLRHLKIFPMTHYWRYKKGVSKAEQYVNQRTGY